MEWRNDAFVKIQAFFKHKIDFSSQEKRARDILGKFIVCIVLEWRLLVWRNPFLPRQFE